MKKLFLICSLGIFMLMLSSCLKDDAPNFYYVPLQIESVDLPEFFNHDETYQISVTYEIPNGCAAFDRIDVTPHNQTTHNVVVFGTQHTDVDTCTEAIEQKSNTFEFKAVQYLSYTFRFWQGEDAEGNQEYFEVVVPVI